MTPPRTAAAQPGQVPAPTTTLAPTSTLAPASTLPTATGPASVITIKGGPDATANIPGSHNDPADFFGSALVILAILGSIALARLAFRRRGTPEPPAEGPR